METSGNIMQANTGKTYSPPTPEEIKQKDAAHYELNKKRQDNTPVKTTDRELQTTTTDDGKVRSLTLDSSKKTVTLIVLTVIAIIIAWPLMGTLTRKYVYHQ